jgi:hypothetical protein
MRIIILSAIYYLLYAVYCFKGGRKGSTGVMRIRLHVVDPSPRKNAEKNTKANNELALAA